MAAPEASTSPSPQDVPSHRERLAPPPPHGAGAGAVIADCWSPGLHIVQGSPAEQKYSPGTFSNGQQLSEMKSSSTIK